MNDGAEDATSGGARSSSDASPPPRRHSWVRRLAPLAAGLVVLGLLSPLEDRLPTTHAVDISLEAPRTVRRIELTATHAGDEPLQATTWNFEPGAAPDRVQTTIHGPNGAYELLVDVVRDDGERASRPHQVELDGVRRVILHAR